MHSENLRQTNSSYFKVPEYSHAATNRVFFDQLVYSRQLPIETDLNGKDNEILFNKTTFSGIF